MCEWCGGGGGGGREREIAGTTVCISIIMYMSGYFEELI